MTQQAFDLGPEERTAAVADLGGAWWLAFSGDTLPEEARAAFLAKFAHEPAEVRPAELGGLVLAGPAPRRDCGRA